MAEQHICKDCNHVTEHFFTIDGETICCGCHLPEPCMRCKAKAEAKKDSD